MLKTKKENTEENSEKQPFGLQFMQSCKELNNIVKKYYKKLLPWIATYFAIAIVSLLMTEYGNNMLSSSFPKTLLLLFPRLFFLFVLTLTSFISDKKYVYFSLLSGFFLLWTGILAKVSPAIYISLFIICAGFALYFHHRNKRNGMEHDPYKAIFKRIHFWTFSFLLLTLAIELVHQFNPIRAIPRIVTNPDMFMLNVAIVMGIGMFVFICKKRNFAFAMYAAFWVILSYISYLKYSNVNEPVLLLDVFQINEGVAAAFKVLDWIDLALIVVILVGLVIGIRAFSKKAKKVAFDMKNLVIILLLYALLPGPIIGAGSVGSMKTHERFLKDIFFHDGFVYSFINYSFKSSITEPKGYSDEIIDDLIESINKQHNSKSGDYPEIKNIIVIQLESFADPNLFPGASFERDPIPFLHYLEENFTTGTIDVPVFGGQTVKSEFEFITGLNMNLLPYGYSPYVQHIDKNTMDSFARYLNSLGYTPTAIHNYQGEFFSRHEVYKNLGFRRFLCYETMPDIEKRPGAIWANDSILKDQIAMVLDDTEGGDFVYTVTVQLHSKYLVIDESEFPMEFEIDGDDEKKARVAYYLGQLEEFDDAIKSIIDYLEKKGEPTFVLMYSDHLPNLFYDVEEMSQDDKFVTKFYTWNNVGLEKLQDRHLELYHLSTYLCDMIGLDGNLVNKFHRVYNNDPEYFHYYKLLQYYLMQEDINKDEYENDDYEIGGIIPFYIDSVTYDEEKRTLTVIGDGFTENTFLCINDKVYDAEYINQSLIVVRDFRKPLAEGDIISVQIIGEKYGALLRESEVIVYRG
jgi:phosphoglycerol transferase MdoB-like AlkP superfamily enzyme